MNAEVRSLKSKAESALADTFLAARNALPGGDTIAAQRDGAFDSFAATGLPHRRVEAWRYTDLRSLMRDAYPIAVPPDEGAKARAREAGAMLAGVDCRRLVVVDGSFAPDLSDLAGLEDGLTVRSVAEALAAGDGLIAAHLGKVVATGDPAVALNTALMGDGVMIRIAAGAAIVKPIVLLSVVTGDTPTAVFTRSLVLVEKGARATLVESYEGLGSASYQVNAALELVVEDTAHLEHVKLTREASDVLHLGTMLAKIGARATFNSFTFTAGGAVVRNQFFVHSTGEAAEIGLRGASLLAGQQHGDTTLFVDHIASGCQSRELFKAVLDDESRAVFQGKIAVHQGAQQTDARMMARALLLSDTAEANSKPELEIFADDVQCGHGSTAGGVDEELKFYLMARGLPEKEAQALLVQAFVGEAIDTVAHDGTREALMNATLCWLGERG